MSRRLLFFLFTAALALVAAFIVHSALRSKEAKIAALRLNTVRIVVAARALTPGETIDNQALRLISWPREDAPPGAFTDLQMVSGRIVKNSLGINQPIVASALLEPEKTGGVLPLLIPPGMRAMSIAVDDVSDMAGFILPHSRVDVLVSVAVSGPASGPGALGQITKIVLQNIRVLAIAQTLEAGPDQPHEVKVVTLLVTPAEAERLAAASRLGTLALAMRNFADHQQNATAGVTLPSLLGIAPLDGQMSQQAPAMPEPNLPLAPRRPRSKAVEVIRNGTDHQTVNFSANGRAGAPPPPSAPPPAAAGSETVPPAQ